MKHDRKPLDAAPAYYRDTESRPDPATETGSAEERQVDETLRQSFPASDPPGWCLGRDQEGDDEAYATPAPGSSSNADPAHHRDPKDKLTNQP